MQPNVWCGQGKGGQRVATDELSEWREVAVASLGLPDEKLLRVLSLVESAPGTGEAQELRRRLRPRLFELRPPRKMTAQRLLFLPAEDVLVSQEPRHLAPGRLSRAFIKPCWQILLACDPDTVQAATDDLRDIGASDTQGVCEIGKMFWKRVGEVLSDYIGGVSVSGRRRVDGCDLEITKDILGQIAQFSDILLVAPEIELVKQRLPARPIMALSEFSETLLRKVINDLAEVSLVGLESFVCVIMARMSYPGDMIKLISSPVVRIDESARLTLVRKLGGSAVAAVAGEAAQMRDVEAITDPNRSSQATEQLVSRLLSLEQSADGGRGNLREQVAAARTDIGTFVVDKLTVALDDSMAAALQALTINLGDGASDEEAEFRLEKCVDECAQSLKRCAGFADTIGIKRELGDRLKEICEKVMRYGEGLGPGPERCQRRLVLLVRLVELLAGPDQAQRVLLTHFKTMDQAIGA